jgi:transposase
MKKSSPWALAPDQTVLQVDRDFGGWSISLDSTGHAACPLCGTHSGSRHSSYVRFLQDFPAHGEPVRIRARVTRWRCQNERCERHVFAGRVPELAPPFARRTVRLAGIVRLFGHAAGGRPSERLLARLGMPVGHTTILRHLKRSAQTQDEPMAVRVAGIDDWAWKKGMTYGTVIVDLEQRRVVEVLADRSAASTAAWLNGHSEVEVVSRDRAGLYADGARQGAPQARQVADRFHLLQNFREAVERQLTRLGPPIRRTAPSADDEQETDTPSTPRETEAERQQRARRGRHADRQAVFARIRALYDADRTAPEIARELGLGIRRVQRWVRLIELPERNTMAPKPSTPAYHGAYLARRWAEGTTKVKWLFAEIRQRGYNGSFGHLARFLAPWRHPAPNGASVQPGSFPIEIATVSPLVAVVVVDPMTGRQISPLTAAALCVKPRGQMTPRQIVNVDLLKAASAEFTTMRHLAMRFGGLFRGRSVDKLNAWLADAKQCGIHAMRRFAAKLRLDIDAVRNAILEPWSNGQVEGQINRLKTLKRAMYGRASVALLRARMMPLHEENLHRD